MNKMLTLVLLSGILILRKTAIAGNGEITMKKRLLSGVLAVAMLFGSAAALPEGVFETSSTITASAETSKATSGKCGENVKWTLKNGVLTISGSGAMYDYSHDYSPLEQRSDITSVVIKSGVTSISGRMFLGCEKIKSISLSNSITSIGKRAFEKCRGLTSVTIPKSVKSIGDDAFCMCSSLTNINIPTSVKSIGGMAFNSTKWLKNQREKNDFVVVNGILIDAAKCTGKVIIPNTVQVIGGDAFLWNGRVTSIKIPNSVKRIEECAFFRCESLKTINIPESVTSIGEEAFYGCTSLKSITIPSNVKSIGKAAFGYKRYEEHIAVEKVTGFTIYGAKGSTAEKYAKDNGFKFVPIRNPEPKSTRLAGANRYETASIISKKMNPKTSGTVIIATGLTFHDAMVAVPLAKAYNAPLLLATEKHITAQTEAELKRLKAKNVIVVSTNGAIGSGAKAELKALGLKTTYIEGKNVFETSTKVAKALQTQNKKAPDTIFFATDGAFADALSASPVAAIKGAPIIYLNNKSIDKTVADYLKSVKGKIKNAYIIGGDGVISNAMMKNVAKALGLTSGKTVQRVAGANRYETCVAVNNKFKSVLSSDGICVAKGLDFPDALAGGVLAAKNRIPLFLADGKKLLDCQNTYLKGRKASKLYVLGGTGAVPDSLVKLIAKASV